MAKQPYHLLHAILAQPKAPLDDPIMKGFNEQLQQIRSMAQNFSGFISQPELPDEGKVFKGDLLLIVSIWESVESLEAFTRGRKYLELLAQSGEWFSSRDYPNYVLFWSPVGEKVTEKEIEKRFELLNQGGPSIKAFTFDRRFTVEALISTEQRKKPNHNLT